jgi:hypothetical protein
MAAKERPESARPQRAQAEERAEPKSGGQDDGPALSDLSDKKLKSKLVRYTEDFQMLAGDPTQAAMTRRLELTRLMRGVQDVLDAREAIVEVTVPASVTGEPYVVGPAVFPPGVYYVRESVARYLLWLIDQNQRVELNRLKSNGRTIDLGHIGQRARMAAISRDTGDDDYQGRGR